MRIAALVLGVLSALVPAAAAADTLAVAEVGSFHVGGFGQGGAAPGPGVAVDAAHRRRGG